MAMVAPWVGHRGGANIKRQDRIAEEGKFAIKHNDNSHMKESDNISPVDSEKTRDGTVASSQQCYR